MGVQQAQTQNINITCEHPLVSGGIPGPFYEYFKYIFYILLL